MEKEHTEQISNIKFVRMITGEDLVSEVVYSEDMGGIVLLNPMKIIYFMNDTQVSLTLVEWIFSSVCKNQSFPVAPSNVIIVSDVTSGLEEMYWTMISKLSLRMNQKEQDDLLEIINEVNEPDASFPDVSLSSKSLIQQTEEEMLLDIQSGKKKLN